MVNPKPFARLAASVYGFGVRHPGPVGLALVILGGLVARAALLPTVGHDEDTRLFYDWARGLAAHGLRGFYTEAGGCNYPPLFVLIMRGLGGLSARADLNLHSESALRMLLKLPACLADLLAAVLLFIEGRRLGRARVGLVASAIYFLNPVTIYNSAYWGQVDGIHSALLVGALLATNRMRPTLAGASLGLALAMKLQSIAFAPLFIFDVYRWRGLRGCAWLLGGALGAALAVLSPFIVAGCARRVLSDGYVGVVGQYAELSVNAFNPWFLFGNRSVPDATVPPMLVRIVARGATDIAESGHWLLHLTWRRISLVLYVTAVAVILSLYSWRRSAWARALCAGALGLAFFLCLTEMHERYSHPVFALLALWAASSAWKERGYLLLSCAALLNLTFALHVDQIAVPLAMLFVLALLSMLAGLALPTSTPQLSPTAADHGTPANVERVGGWDARPAGPQASGALRGIDLAPPPYSRLVRVFRIATAVLFLAVLSAAGLLMWAGQRAAAAPSSGGDVVYLSDLPARSPQQGWGTLGLDHSVAGGLLHLGNRYYVRGLGTHAPFRVVYLVPPGYDVFEALVGINHDFDGEASISVLAQGHSPVGPVKLRAGEEPLHIQVTITGAKTLQLVGTSDESIRGDHIDWVLARLIKQHSDAPATLPSNSPAAAPQK